MKGRDEPTPEVQEADTFHSLPQLPAEPTGSPHAGDPHSKVSLRRKAEAHVQQREDMSSEKTAELSPENLMTILHELRVHQIELEMQNEELRRVQAALEAERARYFYIFDLAPVGYVTLNAEGLILEANLTAANLLGMGELKLTGRHLSHFILREDRDLHHQFRRRLAYGGGTQTCELRMGKTAGTAFWVHLSATAVPDPDGGPACRVALSDITERKQAEESHARLAMAVEQAAEVIVITAANAAILYVNPAFEKTTGYTRAEALGQNPRILKSGTQDAGFYHRMWDTLRRGEVWHGRFVNKRKDGTHYEEDATISPVRDTAGKIVNYVAVKRDVTRETQLENQLRQAQKMQAVGRLAGGIAHDFNNILMAILGYSDMAMKALPASDPVRKLIEEVHAAGTRAAALTRQLLAFSRKQVLLPRVFSLNDLAANLSEMLRRLIGEDIQLVTAFDPTSGQVKADPGQIEQVIANLAVNSRDAMPHGGTLTIGTANVELDESYASQYAEVSPGRYVLLTVTDTGTGMTDEVKAHIFEPFFTTKDQAKGTGLGLAIIFGIVKQSGGHITLDSEPGYGATFKVYLPRVERAGEVAVPRGASGEVPYGTETILLVEDNESVRKLARMVLEERGYTMLMAGNGAEAIELARRYAGEIHLLLTDMIMPGMSGLVLAPLLVSSIPGLKVLYMSGFTDAAIERQDLATIGSSFLQKPFTADLLAHQVRALLDAPAGPTNAPD
jgi:two-component system cell cycle sensor histidine kinase/response regulator CckA